MSHYRYIVANFQSPFHHGDFNFMWSCSMIKSKINISAAAVGVPKVSVLMPVYNTPQEFLMEAIESILNQSFSDFELIILNDASPDANVERVVKCYHDPRIKYYRNDRNQGISESRNKLIDLALGEYLAVFDHDDVSLPQRLEKQVTLLDKNPDIGVVGCWFKMVGSDEVQKLPVKNADIKKQLFTGCCLAHSSTMIRKKVLRDNNIKYEAVYSPSEDYALWCRLIDKTKFANIPEVLFLYRNHEGNTSHKQSVEMKETAIRIMDFVKRDNPELWAVAQQDLLEVSRGKLCGLIPLLTIKKYQNKTVWLLGGKIPLWSSKGKQVVLTPD